MVVKSLTHDEGLVYRKGDGLSIRARILSTIRKKNLKKNTSGLRIYTWDCYVTNQNQKFFTSLF